MLSYPASRRACAFVVGIACAAAGTTALSQTMTPAPVRIHFIRVLGQPLGTQSSTAAAAADWVDPPNSTSSNPSLASKLTTIVTKASAILTNSSPSPTSANITLQPFTVSSTTVQDLVDPSWPFSFYTVWLGMGGSGSAWKDAMEAACEADPRRFAFEVGAINVYLCDTLNGNALGGVCSFPLSSNTFSSNPDEDDIIFMSNSTLPMPLSWRLNFYANTLAHELGHYFGLLHTDNTAITLSGMGGPSATPTSCLSPTSITTGDLVSDTPYDPWPVLTGITPAISLLAAWYVFGGTACTADAATLQYNPMAFYYTDMSWQGTGLTFTQGQRARMLGYLLGARAKVVATNLAPSINNVLPYTSDYSAGNATLNITGVNLPMGGTAAGVDVALGRLVCISPPGGAVTCGPETDILPLKPQVVTDVIPGSSISVLFHAPVPPGLHTLTIRKNGNVVAVFPYAPAVTPYLESVVSTSEQLSLTVTTRLPFTPFIVILEVPNGAGPYTNLTVPPFTPATNPTLAGVAYSSLLNVANPYVIFPNATGGSYSTTASNFYTLAPMPLIPFLSGARFFAQAVELVAVPGAPFGTFTNVVSIGTP